MASTRPACNFCKISGKSSKLPCTRLTFNPARRLLGKHKHLRILIQADQFARSPQLLGQQPGVPAHAGGGIDDDLSGLRIEQLQNLVGQHRNVPYLVRGRFFEHHCLRMGNNARAGKIRIPRPMYGNI